MHRNCMVQISGVSLMLGIGIIILCAVLIKGSPARGLSNDWVVRVPVTPTNGAVWPRPQQIKYDEEFFSVASAKFSFQMTGSQCSMINKATARYMSLIWREASLGGPKYKVDNFEKNPKYKGPLSQLQVYLNNNTTCEKSPYMGMDESYTLTISNKLSELRADSTWGILRGLETFLQLLYPIMDGKTLLVHGVTVKDAPRFPHRGLLLDTSRHYLPVRDILVEIDALAAVKMNVLHWHIVDDQSFPYYSEKFPALSNNGAYDNVSAVYTQKDIRYIVDYAKFRGIRVIPEFDTPGHTLAWSAALPGFLTECYDRSGRPTGQFSNVDVTKQENLQFLEQFFAEVSTVFMDDYIHIGGDEVPTSCWDQNPDVMKYMNDHNIPGQYSKLASNYIQWLVGALNGRKKNVIAWEEVFTKSGSDKPPKNTIIHSWLSSGALYQAVRAGYQALQSRGWYLDSLDTNWVRMYEAEPTTSDMTSEEKKRVLGGEACMWGELVDSTNVHSRIWPRAAAVAERLWSPQNVNDKKDAGQRIEELTCRLGRRNIPASPPTGPSFCIV